MGPARIIVYILASLLGLVIVAGGLFYFLAPHADLRTDEVRRAGADPDAMARGRRLLEEAAEAHGLAAWRRHTTCEVVAIDHWPGGGPRGGRNRSSACAPSACSAPSRRV